MTQVNYRAHLFICTNRRDGKACCASKGAETLREKVKARAKELWGKDVRVNAAGCLDRCEKGIAAVIYPQGRWLTNLSQNDDQVLIDSVSEVLVQPKGGPNGNI